MKTGIEVRVPNFKPLSSPDGRVQWRPNSFGCNGVPEGIYRHCRLRFTSNK